MLGLIGKKPWPAVVSSRLQRYQIRAAEFDFELRYRKGALNVLADFGSRYPANEKPDEEDGEELIRTQVNSLDERKLNLQYISERTREESFLAKLRSFLLHGWPDEIPNEFKIWYRRRESLSVEENCVLFDDRVWIPTDLRRKVLETLHEGHRGVVKMKDMARKILFWPNLTKDVDNYVKGSERCFL